MGNILDNELTTLNGGYLYAGGTAGTYLGRVRHPKKVGEAWDPDGTPVPSTLALGIDSSLTIAVHGYKCPVRISYQRTGVDEFQDLIASNGYSLTLVTGHTEVLDNFSFRGL